MDDDERRAIGIDLDGAGHDDVEGGTRVLPEGSVRMEGKNGVKATHVEVDADPIEGSDGRDPTSLSELSPSSRSMIPTG